MTEIPLWPTTPPGDESFDPASLDLPEDRNDGITRLPLITNPTITHFPAPPETANGGAVIVCPGGGYYILSWDLEGTEIAAWLNSLGFHAIILKYRVPRRDAVNPSRAPLQDAQRALGLVREKADDWKIDPNRIGMIGFSAGAHLSIKTALAGNTLAYPELDASDQHVRPPDFLAAIYPAYLGDEEKPGPLYPDIQVTPQFPPTFVAVTQDDLLRGRNSALFYVELQNAGVPAELHVYTRGGHGYGLRPSENPVSAWHHRCGEWLKREGWMKPR